MSYSFGVKMGSKAAAIDAVRVELDKVVAAQPIHARDRDEAQGCAEAMIGVLADDDTKDVGVSVSGYVSWNGSDAEQRIQTAQVSVTANLRDR